MSEEEGSQLLLARYGREEVVSAPRRSRRATAPMVAVVAARFTTTMLQPSMDSLDRELERVSIGSRPASARWGAAAPCFLQRWSIYKRGSTR